MNVINVDNFSSLLADRASERGRASIPLPNSPADIIRAGPGTGPMSAEAVMLSPRPEAVAGAKVFDSFSFAGDQTVRECNERFVGGIEEFTLRCLCLSPSLAALIASRSSGAPSAFASSRRRKTSCTTGLITR